MAIAATPEGPDLLPASIELSGAEMQLANRTGREYVLREALAEVADDYDVVLIDCSPSLGVLTINALTAATEVLIPMQAETLSHRGVSQLLETIDDVRRYTNRDLRIMGCCRPCSTPARDWPGKCSLTSRRSMTCPCCHRYRVRCVSPRRREQAVRCFRPRGGPRRPDVPRVGGPDDGEQMSDRPAALRRVPTPGTHRDA